MLREKLIFKKYWFLDLGDICCNTTSNLNSKCLLMLFSFIFWFLYGYI